MSQPTQSRQRPVSCRFCRSRKLRCDREVPCSSCVSRGISCELEQYARPVARADIIQERGLVERVRRLEELVQSQKSQLDNAAKSQPARAPDVFGEMRHISGLSPHVNSPQLNDSHIDQTQVDRLDSDVAFLESIYSGQGAAVNPFPLRCEGRYTAHDSNMPLSRIVFKVCPIQQIMDAPQYINQSGSTELSASELSRCIWLPQHSEARVLLDKYVQDIDHFHHIVHVPSLPSLVDNFYASLNRQGNISPGVVIFLLAVFATATYSWVAEDLGRGVFPEPAEANRQLQLWTKSVEDVLDIAHRTTTVSIEGVQGAIITFWVLFNREGFTRRAWSLWNMALMLGRQLNLHFLDHPSNSGVVNEAETEIKRRVWWYIVASDWAASSRFAGSYSGVYQCHVRQMLVKRPMNLNDEDLVDGMNLIEKPLSQPTTMSYSIFRIRLAEISRHITDRTPIVMAQSSIPKHDTVMDIDVELQQLLNDIPPYFSMPIPDLIKKYDINQARAKCISFQGHMLSTLFHSQRCILHFPYYSRGFVDPEYASSREICFQSARLIIQTEMNFKELPLRRLSRFNYLGLFVAVFMASIVFFMHSCHNRCISRPEVQFKELNDAIELLDEARHESLTASKFLESLMQMVRKHLMSPTQHAAPSQTHELGKAQNSGVNGQATHDIPVTKDVPMDGLPGDVPAIPETDLTSGDEPLGGEDLSVYFTELAQNFEQGVDFNSFDWENIFSGLDSSFV